ncbi:MAG: hypothetical protein EXQ79_02520 [Acidimicrobiia bacterium]|nr:hypothetical protein [Acidimicrobiia bacterium]
MGSSRILAVIIAAALGAPIAFAGTAAATAHVAARPKVTASGFTFNPDEPDATYAGEVTAAAVVSNPTGKVAVDVVVVLTLKDQRGRTIIDNQTTLAYIAPGDDSYATWTTTYPEKKVPVKLTAKVTGVGEMMSARAWGEDAQYDFQTDTPVALADVALEFADLTYQDSSIPASDPMGIASSIVGSVRSVSGNELAGLDVTCVAFEGSDVVGGGHMVLPIIPEGAEAGVQAPNLVGGLEPDDLRCSGRVEYLEARVGARAEQLTVQDAGFALTSLDEYSVGAVIENPTDQFAWGVHVVFDVLAADGKVIGSRSSDVPLYVAPHSTVYAAPLLPGTPREFAGTPFSLRVLTNAYAFQRPGRAIREEAGFDPAAWKFEISDVGLDGSGHAVGTITNRSKKAVNAVDMICGLFSGGAMVGATSESLDESDLGSQLVPGKALKFEVGVSLDSTGANDVRCVATISQYSDV